MCFAYDVESKQSGKSLHFYTDIMGMKLLREEEYPEHEFTPAFVGYGDESDTAVLELMHNLDTGSYALGNAYGHVARYRC